VLHRLAEFFQEGLWQGHFQKDRKSDPFYIRFLKVLAMAVQGFIYDQCGLRASALTYYSLLAIVPILALIFGIAKGFALDALVEKEILVQFQTYEAVASHAIDFARKLLEETKGGIIAGFGVIILVLTLIKMIGNIEESFNHIWFVRKGRNWKRMVTDYLSISWIVPLLLITSSSTVVLMAANLQDYVGNRPISLFYEVLPIFVTFFLLTFIYLFMPNTKVSFRSAVTGGFWAALIFHFFHALYVYFQVKISNYGAIYGSFAAFPLFLFWLQISWMIVLFGAEIAYSLQNLGIYGLKRGNIILNLKEQKLLSLAIVRLVVRDFREEKGPASLKRMSDRIGAPTEIVYRVTLKLIESGLLSPVVIDEMECYQPAVSTQNLRVADIMKALERSGSHVVMGKSDDLLSAKNVLGQLEKDMDQSEHNTLIREL